MAGRLARLRDEARASLAWANRHAAGLLVTLGVLLRLVDYGADRSYWIDESRLAENIVGRAPLDLRPMTGDQLAPLGFLVLARLGAALFGDSRFVLRLVPLLGAMAAVPLFVSVSRRCLRPRARLVALALFALSDPLIYYAGELKPYGVDVAASLAAWRLAIGLRSGRRSTARLLTTALGGMALALISFPVAFVLAAVGVVAVAGAWAQGRWRGMLASAAVAALWLAAAGAGVGVGRRLLGPSSGMMNVFWSFAFPTAGMEAVAWVGRRLVNLFAMPVHFDTPLGPAASAVLGAALAVLGLSGMARRRLGWALRSACRSPSRWSRPEPAPTPFTAGSSCSSCRP